MQTADLPQSGPSQHKGTGGFLNPDRIVVEFGLEEGMNVADFGCGAGYFTILMAKIVGQEGRVNALDVLETALDSVRIKAKASGVENIETIRANLEVVGSSGLADSSQDVSLLANILFQSNKKELIIREAARVLKEGGLLILIDWAKGTDGFGPPDELRVSKEEARAIASGEGLLLVREIDSGHFHFGMVFQK